MFARVEPWPFPRNHCINIALTSLHTQWVQVDCESILHLLAIIYKMNLRIATHTQMLTFRQVRVEQKIKVQSVIFFLLFLIEKRILYSQIYTDYWVNMYSTKLMHSHKLRFNSLKIHRSGYQFVFPLPSWIPLLRLTSPLCLIAFYVCS